MRRRGFLKATAATVAATAMPSLFGCTDNETVALTVFPQGVGSGDPRPGSIVLWTRVEPTSGNSEQLEYELARDEAFWEVVSKGTAEVGPESDFTFRVKVEGLTADTRYFYRFKSRGVFSTLGRTKTAPAPDSDARVSLAFASCQDLVGRYFHSWRVLGSQQQPVDFVVFLGDYIYETTATKGARTPTAQRHLDLPDGLALGATEEEGRAAVTLTDFRAAYRQYRSDPDLRRIHAQVPFISVWDDHEFGNDSWQDHTNHFDGKQGDEQNTPSRQAASQAFSEYLALDVERDATAAFPHDLTLYRSLRFGKHVELFITDQRSYRSDQVIPEGPRDESVGKYGTNTSIGSRTLVVKEGFDPKEAQANPTMLGAAQRQWLIDGVRGSSATWKLIGSQTMVAQLLTDLTHEEGASDLVRKRFYLKLDQWDGYRSERQAILSALADIQGVVWLSGDLHATYASELRPDFDTDGPATCVEYLVPSISSISLQEQLVGAVRLDPILDALGLAPIVRRIDDVVRSSNPHVRFTKNSAYGFATVDVSAGEVGVTFTHLSDVVSAEPPTSAERVAFRTRLGANAVETGGE